MDTSGNGGHHLRKSIVIYTNEKSAPQRSLTISGKVDRIYTMTPRRINLHGAIGKAITASAKIVPENKYPFTITKVRAIRGKDIDLSWEETKKEGRIEYILNVKNLKKEKGRYTDTIVMDTDSDILPQIRIAVSGNISEPN